MNALYKGGIVSVVVSAVGVRNFYPSPDHASQRLPLYGCGALEPGAHGRE